MNTPRNFLPNLFPVLAATISALALLGGYWYQKKAERDGEIQRNRQEIYSRLIGNITERNMLLGRLEQSPEYIRAKPEERSQVESQISLKDDELTRNEGDRTEVVASLVLFGTDEAIAAYAKYAKANVEGKGGDLGQLILDLRQSISKTHIKTCEADLAIWNDPKCLNQLSQAKVK